MSQLQQQVFEAQRGARDAQAAAAAAARDNEELQARVALLQGTVEALERCGCRRCGARAAGTGGGWPVQHHGRHLPADMCAPPSQRSCVPSIHAPSRLRPPPTPTRSPRSTHSELRQELSPVRRQAAHLEQELGLARQQSQASRCAGMPAL